MEEALRMVQSQDPRTRAAGMDCLREHLASEGNELAETAAKSVVQFCTKLLKRREPQSSELSLDVLTAAISQCGERLRPHVNGVVPLVLEKLGNDETAVREAARRFLATLMEMKEAYAMAPKKKPETCYSSTCNSSETSARREVQHLDINYDRNSPTTNLLTVEFAPFGEEYDVSENSIEPAIVKSDKELVHEIEKIASALVPETEWTIRIVAMQRIERLVVGGAAGYSVFPMLLKHLVTPLTNQLLDRRSSVVKQACHLLCFLSKELKREFEGCAELFIPVLFKLVVITVLVIAESADSCIKILLYNCKVSRVLPRIIECAKNDRSATLRLRCCEYALLMLDYWVDAPEIHRSAHLYEDLIKCCIEDATPEVRSNARACYRLFSKIWPDRSSHLFSSFDPHRQKVIAEEDGAIHRKWIPPENPVQSVKTSFESSFPVQETFPRISVEKCDTVGAETFMFRDDLLSQMDLQCSPECSISHVDAINQVAIIEDSHGFDNLLKMQSDLVGNSEKSSEGFEISSVPHPVSMSSISSDDTTTTTTIVVQDRITTSSPDLFVTSTALHEDESSQLPKLSLPNTVKMSGSAPEANISKENHPDQLLKKQPIDSSQMDGITKDMDYNQVPHFQRPLLSKQIANLYLADGRNDLGDRKAILDETIGYSIIQSSLSEVIASCLKPQSDWMVRVSAFNFIRSTLQRGKKGVQEVTCSFDKVMKLFFRYLDDPHHKVAFAAFSTMEALIPACRKPFESYLERSLPYVFSRLNDPKESIRQQCTTILDIVGATYGIDSLLPGIIRSLDGQKAAKAQIAVIEFANGSFRGCTLNSDSYGSNSFIKPWLGKLTRLYKNKNSKLKAAVLIGFTVIHSYYDPTSVVSYIMTLAVEEQKFLRLGLKQHAPAIEDDLVKFMLSKKQKKHYATEIPAISVGLTADKQNESSKSLNRSMNFQRSATGFVNDKVVRKDGRSIVQQQQRSLSASEMIDGKTNDKNERREKLNGNMDNGFLKASDSMKAEVSILPSHPHTNISVGSKFTGTTAKSKNEDWQQTRDSGKKTITVMDNHQPVPQYVNQVLSALLEMLGNPDTSVRALALSLLVEMLSKQPVAMEDHIEAIVLKLLHATNDAAMKIVNEAQACLTSIVAGFDPLRCLKAIAPILSSNDDKILIVSISSLTKLVGRFSDEALMTQLPAFLPALVNTFENQSPYVRKAVVLCLANVYLKLGKSFLPYLGRLSNTQLQLVTTYAQRVSQAKQAAAAEIQS